MTEENRANEGSGEQPGRAPTEERLCTHTFLLAGVPVQGGPEGLLGQPVGPGVMLVFALHDQLARHPEALKMLLPGLQIPQTMRELRIVEFRRAATVSAEKPDAQLVQPAGQLILPRPR